MTMTSPLRLIGMLDSPYVRRTAISLEFLGVPFQHEAVSVFKDFEKFQRINPAVQAPTLVCPDGEVLMDSSLILQYIEAIHAKGESLWSAQPDSYQHQVRAVGLAISGCDRSVQIVYERNIKPTNAQYEPWLTRITGQLLAAYQQLEQQLQTYPTIFTQARCQASITTAVVWQFTQSMLAAQVPAADFPLINSHAARMEALPQFKKYPPVGPGV